MRTHWKPAIKHKPISKQADSVVNFDAALIGDQADGASCQGSGVRRYFAGYNMEGTK